MKVHFRLRNRFACWRSGILIFAAFWSEPRLCLAGQNRPKLWIKQRNLQRAQNAVISPSHLVQGVFYRQWWCMMKTTFPRLLWPSHHRKSRRRVAGKHCNCEAVRYSYQVRFHCEWDRTTLPGTWCLATCDTCRRANKSNRYWLPSSLNTAMDWHIWKSSMQNPGKATLFAVFNLQLDPSWLLRSTLNGLVLGFVTVTDPILSPRIWVVLTFCPRCSGPVQRICSLCCLPSRIYKGSTQSGCLCLAMTNCRKEWKNNVIRSQAVDTSGS